MKEIFNNFTAWFWPFLSNIFTSLGEFIAGIFTSLSSNQSDIVTVIGYMAFAAISLFLLKKLLDFLVGYFTGFTKNDVKDKSKKAFVYTLIILLISSFISYKMGTASCP